MCGIKANRSSALHQQTDGHTERTNSMLEQYLRIYKDYQQTDWVSLLTLAEFEYHNSKHSAPSLTQFFANYGFHPRMSLLPPSPDSRTPAADSSVHQLREAQDILQRELKKSREAMERSANQRRCAAPNLVMGQKVRLLRRHIHNMRPSSRLDVCRLGPFSILEQIGSSAFRLALPSAIMIHPIFHVNLREPHVENSFPGRI